MEQMTENPSTPKRLLENEDEEEEDEEDGEFDIENFGRLKNEMEERK